MKAYWRTVRDYRFITTLSIFISAICMLCWGSLEERGAHIQAKLASVDMARAMVIRAEGSNGATSTVTGSLTGSVDQFLMADADLEALRAMPVVNSVHEFRQISLSVRLPDEDASKDLKFFIVPPGFLSAHKLGQAGAEGSLEGDCLVVSTELASTVFAGAKNVNVDLSSKSKAVLARYGYENEVGFRPFEVGVCPTR